METPQNPHSTPPPGTPAGPPPAPAPPPRSLWRSPLLHSGLLYLILIAAVLTALPYYREHRAKKLLQEAGLKWDPQTSSILPGGMTICEWNSLEPAVPAFVEALSASVHRAWFRTASNGGWRGRNGGCWGGDSGGGWGLLGGDFA